MRRRKRKLAQARQAEAQARLDEALGDRVYEEARSVVLDEQLRILREPGGLLYDEGDQC